MTTLVGLILFAAILQARAAWQRTRFLAGAAQRGWTVGPNQITATSYGPSISKSVGALQLTVAVPYITGESGGWKQRWQVKLGGTFSVPQSGTVLSRRGYGATIRSPRGLRRLQASLSDFMIIRAGSTDVITSLPEGARRTLGDAFRQHGPITEALLLPTTLELRVRRLNWSFDELDSLTPELVALGEALLVDRR